MVICLQRSISDSHMVLLMPQPPRHLLWFLANVRYMLSPVRLSLSVVCLSVCRLSVTLMRPTQAVEIFHNIFTALGTLAIH